MTRLLISFLFTALHVSAPAAEPGGAIRFAGQNTELAISEVSERTVRVELSPLDDQDKPRPAMPSSVLVPFPMIGKLRVRELSGEKELGVGQLRVRVKAQPLTVT